MSLIRSCRKWAKGELFADICQLVAEESEFVDGQVCKTPNDLLNAFGLREEEDEEMNGTKGLDDIAVIVKILKDRPSWGEFIGGVLASFGEWDRQVQHKILPQLKKTVHTAAENGVDH